MQITNGKNGVRIDKDDSVVYVLYDPTKIDWSEGHHPQNTSIHFVKPLTSEAEEQLIQYLNGAVPSDQAFKDAQQFRERSYRSFTDVMDTLERGGISQPQKVFPKLPKFGPTSAQTEQSSWMKGKVQIQWEPGMTVAYRLRAKDIIKKLYQYMAAKGLERLLAGTIRVGHITTGQNASGICHWYSGIVEINPYSSDQDYLFLQVLCHELGHRIHITNSIQMDGEIQRAYGRVPANWYVTNYARTDYLEFWAELFCYWVLNYSIDPKAAQWCANMCRTYLPTLYTRNSGYNPTPVWSAKYH